MTIGELMEALEQRVEGHSKWLGEQRPEIFAEQKHCETEVHGVACIERIYWHYGYMVACRDVLRQLKSLGKDN
jgi:hypothetical protein